MVFKTNAIYCGDSDYSPIQQEGVDSIMKNGGEKCNIQRLDSTLKGKLNKLTYRQYLALALILTKIDDGSNYPSKEELKKMVGFKTDRMLKVTLEALEGKGFIKFYGLEYDPILKILDETKKATSVLTDELLLIEDYTPYSKVKNKIHGAEKKDHLPQMDLPISIDRDYLKFLNDEKQIVNRWYTLLEDFPPSLVWDKFEKYSLNSNNTVLDPFAGSGTTVVTAKLYGSKVIGIDVNPVAAFVTKVKTTWKINLEELKTEINSLLNDFQEVSPFLEEVRMSAPSLENIPKMERYQWLKPLNQNYVAFVKERLTEVLNDDIRNLFHLALVEAAQESSNVSFCPGTSFYPFKKRVTFFEAFNRKLRMMYEDLSLVKLHGVTDSKIPVYAEDMRQMTEFVAPSSIDFIFTSPPYPNDLEYTRQTRLDLYLLEFVKDMKDVTEIKKKMVKGSTKLIYKESDSAKYVEECPLIQDIVHKLRDAFKDKKWGWDYPRMVGEYFGDIFLAMEQTREVLKEGCCAQFVVGDQTYKQILIPVGKIMVEMGKKLNYRSSKLETFRVRRSTLHDIPLKEEIVILRK